MLSTEDKNEIVAILNGFEDARAKRDMVGFRAMLIEDCDWVNLVGMHWHGCNEVTGMYHVLLEGRYKGVKVHAFAVVPTWSQRFSDSDRGKSHTRMAGDIFDPLVEQKRLTPYHRNRLF